MKPGQYFSLIIGIFFTAAGIMGFFSGFVFEPTGASASVDVAHTGYGYLLGLFPVNALHNTVHLLIGLLGIASAIALDSTRVYCRGLAIFYGALAIMGLIPYANTTFGLIPIFGNDVWLHASTAAIAFYYGFIASPGLLEISDPSGS